MNKFIKNLTLSDSGIKEKRARILGEQAKTAQQDLVTRLTKEKNSLDLKLDSLQDLAPDQNTSLRPGGENFNADTWVNQIQDTKIELLNKQIELKIATETFTEWFTAAPADETKSGE